eukprot:Skav216857  [mRNA]  locus=scaffold1042:88560:94433:- [translate_table: standard]
MEAVRFLVEAGADMNQATNDGAIPLFIAAHNGHIETVRFLVEAGADINQAMNDGATPVLIAAQNGHMEAVRLLVGAGADMNQAMNHGETPLFIAAHNGHIETVRFLVEAGAGINQAMNDGATPVLIAAHNGHMEAAEHIAASASSNATSLMAAEARLAEQVQLAATLRQQLQSMSDSHMAEAVAICKGVLAGAYARNLSWRSTGHVNLESSLPSTPEALVAAEAPSEVVGCGEA